MFRGNKIPSGPRREHRFKKGVLKYVVLDLLDDEPRHGYEIIRALEERSHGFYTPSPGAVYPTLQMLQEAGYVTSEERDGKKVCTITDEGRSFLAERADITEGVKNQMESWWNPEHTREMGMTWMDVGKIAGLLNRKNRGASAEKMAQIRGVLGDAYDKIDEILED